MAAFTRPSTKRRFQESGTRTQEPEGEKKFRISGSELVYYCANPLLGPRCRALPKRFAARAPKYTFFPTKAACAVGCLSPERKEAFILPPELQSHVKSFL